MQDRLGRTINAGDTVAYCVRSGSSLRMKVALVQSTTDDTARVTPLPGYNGWSGFKPSNIHTPDYVVILQSPERPTMSEYSAVLRAVKATAGRTSTQLMQDLKQDSLQTVVDALTLLVANGIVTKSGTEPTATYTAVAGRS